MNRYNALLAFMGSITLLYTYIAEEQERKNVLRKRDEKRAERKACMAMGFDTFTNTYMKNYDASDSTLDGDHPKQNLVKGRITAKDYSRSWCEYLSKKLECAKLRRSDEPRCKAYKNILRIDCATWDGVVSSLFLQLCLLSFWTWSCYILYAHRDHIPLLLTIGLAC